MDLEGLAVSLKRYPDTAPQFLRSLFSRAVGVNQDVGFQRAADEVLSTRQSHIGG